MVNFKASKEVSSLPETLEANTTYWVRSGEGFDLYCSDSTGRTAHKLNTGEALSPSDREKLEKIERLESDIQALRESVLGSSSSIEVEDPLVKEGNTLKLKRKVDKYLVDLGTNTVISDNYGGREMRAFCEVDRATGLGIIHLDIKFTPHVPGGEVIANLPAECPTPTSLIEVMVPNGGVLYANGSRRWIKKAWSFKENTRYIVNLIGFFNDDGVKT